MEKEWSTLKKLIWLHMILGGGAVNWTTVTGASPLSLVNALAKPIRSLVQYGKCVQDGTPTPSAPVDIVCNNGALCMTDNELPRSYKRITGIKFDGDFWYNTGEVLNGGDAVTMTLANTATGGQNVFGSYNGTAGGKKNFSLFIYGGGASNGSYYRYGEQLLRPRFGGGERTITISGNGTDGFTTDVIATPDTFVTEAPAYIGMLPNSSSASYTGSIMGSIDVVNNGQLRLRWIPCERQSDGAVGYYELKSGTFLEHVGTGTPIKGGYDTSRMTELIVDGTPEVLSLGTQTASVQNLYAAGDYKDTQEIIGGTVKRNVGIKVFDGTEEWVAHTVVGTYRYRFEDKKVEKSPFASTHFVYSSKASGDISNGEMMCGAASPNAYFRNTDCATLADFTAWLASQYAAGTPVIVIYPLAEESTEQVAGQPLSTGAGDNVLTVTAEISDIQLTAEYAASA